MSVRPFSTGSQYAGWSDKNCSNCWKTVKSGKRFNCSIEKELGKAYWDNGEIPDEIAARMGIKHDNSYTWDCPEREQNRPPRAKKPKPIVDLIGIFNKL